MVASTQHWEWLRLSRSGPSRWGSAAVCFRVGGLVDEGIFSHDAFGRVGERCSLKPVFSSVLPLRHEESQCDCTPFKIRHTEATSSAVAPWGVNFLVSPKRNLTSQSLPTRGVT